MKDQDKKKEQLESELEELRRRIAELEQGVGGHARSDAGPEISGLHGSASPDERYRSLFEQSRDAIAIVREDGRFVDANQSLMDLYGYSREEIMQMNVSEIWADPTQRSIWQRDMAQFGSITDYECQTRKKDGTLLHSLLTSTQRYEEDGSVVYQSIIRDVSDRKRALESLKESEELYRQIAENSLAGLYIHDGGVLLYVNRALAEMMGYSPEEMIGRQFREFAHPDDCGSALRKSPTRSSDHSSSPRYLFRVLCKNGDVKWFEATAATISFQGRRADICHLIDLTERLNIEEALRESEASFRALSEAAFEAIFLSEKGVFLSQNLAAEKMFGYSAEEAEGRFATYIIGPEYRDLVVEKIRSGYEEPYEAEGLRKDGSTFPCEIQGKMVDYQGRQIRVTALRDISARKIAEDTARKSQERYRDLFENAIDAMYTLDLDGAFTSANKAAERLMGVDRERLLTMNLRDVIASGDLPDALENLKSVAEAGIDATGPYEIRIRRPDGTRRWAEVTSRILRKAGTPDGIHSMARDVTDRKLAAEALRQSEEKYRDLVELLPQPVFEIDSATRVTFASSKGFEFFRYSREEFTSGIPVAELIAVEDRSRILQDMQKVFLGEHLGSQDYTALRKDGSTFPILVHAVPLRHGNTITGMRGIVVDMTSRRKAEEQLRISEERLRMAWETSPDAFSISHLIDGTFVEVNKGFTELTGYTPEETIGKSGTDLGIWFNPDDRPPLMDRLLRDGSVRNLETVFRQKNGQLRTVLISAGLMILNGEPHLLALTKDIEQLKQAQESLALSERIFRKYFELGLVGMALTSPQKAWLYVNDRICQILGYTREELLGKTWPELTHPDDRSIDLEQFNRLLSGEIEGYAVDLRFIRGDGSTVYTTLHVSCIRGPEKEVEHVIAHLHDITDRKHLEEQLLQAGKMEAIGQLAGGLAHDFNNILTAIIGYCGLLGHDLQDNTPSLHKLHGISRAAEKAADLTRQLLAFSRKQVLDTKVRYLNEILRDLEGLLKRLIGEDVELTTALDPSAGTVDADPVQIQQILMNLAVNARDAMPKGGRLTIETANTVLDDDYVGIYPEVVPGPHVMFAVTDSGNGMDSQTIERIFEPFFTTKEKGVGTGLGLATVYGIVKQHRGHITVSSEPGRGTTFKVYLPRAKGLPDSSLAEARRRTRPRGSETVLVVEDDETVRSLVRDALGLLGYTALSACEPSEAIEICNSHEGPIHLLLTDVVLPEIDGRSLFVTLSLTRPELKVLYVSGYTEDYIVHHGVLEKGVHFLQKPFHVDQLADKVRQILDGG